MTNKQLEVHNLHVYYGQSHILQGVDLAVGDQPIALIGRNGMGKTTLCKALMGLLPLAQGDIFFAGQKLSGRKPYHIAAHGIGYVPQGRHIFPSLTVHEHMQLVRPRTSSANGSSSQRWTIERIYDLFPRLAERRKVGAGALSGGEQQMLAIGRALLINAQLLIMDEPSEGLAPSIVEQLLATLKKLSNDGIGLFIVEQKLSVATALADQIFIMVAGRIALETTSEQLLASEEMRRRYLGVDNRVH